jgi:hypothetical protein
MVVWPLFYVDKRAVRSVKRTFWRLAGTVLFGGGLLSLRAAELEEDLKLSFWDKSVNLRGALGYKDNVLLSDIKREGSGFWLSAFDFSMFRASLDNGPGVTIFASAEDRRYFSSPDLTHEDIVLSQVKVTQEFLPGWTVGVLAQYLYADEVFDASATEQLFDTLPVKSHNLQLAPMLIHSLPWNSELELKFGGERQIFEESLDDYWQFGPELTLTKRYGNHSTVSFAYRYDHRLYRSRFALDLQRLALDDTPLRFNQHELELLLTHSFDQARHWRSRTRLLLGINQDSGVGYYDYRRYRAIQRFGYYGKDWQLSIEGKALYYDYQKQPIPDGVEIRQLWQYFAGLHGEKTVWKKLKVFADYEYETVKSNFRFERYNVNTVMGGVDWEF